MPAMSRDRWLQGGVAAAALSGAAALVLLLVQVAADPATGMTFSDGPFTDEGWSVMGARNFVLLGRWATDEWQLVWAQLPFNVAHAVVFKLFGVGIVQARMVVVACTAIATVLIGAFVGRRCGTHAGLVAGIGFGTCALVAYYGRLAILEPMVVLFLVAGFAALHTRPTSPPAVPGISAGVALALAIGTKPSAGVAVAGVLLGALVTGRGVRGVARRIGAAVGVIVASGAVWAVFVLSQPGLIDSILRIWPQETMPISLAELWDRVYVYVRNSDLALSLTAPVLVAALLGSALAAFRWRALDPYQRVAVGSALGWLILGWAILLVVPYRPNRFVVPLVPPMAVLAGYGWALALKEMPRWVGDRGRWIVPGATAALCAVLAFDGAARVTDWTMHATYRLPAIQDELLGVVTDGRAIEGGPGPTMAMRVPVPTIIVKPFVNTGDLYATHGVRWVFAARDTVPSWAAAHPEAWAARELVACYPWPSGEACLTHVP